MSSISNHGSLQLIRKPLSDLLEAVTAESDQAFPDFKRWCDTHFDLLAWVALNGRTLPASSSRDRTFEEALAFVRLQLQNLDVIRSTTGLDPVGESRYDGLRVTELDLIGRVAEGKADQPVRLYGPADDQG
jgi:hypothetical protein